MDFIYSSIPIVFGLFFGLSPWLLVLIPLANRKIWSWWSRTAWKGSLLLAFASLVIKIGAEYIGWFIRIWIGYT